MPHCETCFSCRLLQEGIGPETKFNFICEDELAAQYKDDLKLKYTLYIDGKPAGKYDQIPGYVPGYNYDGMTMGRFPGIRYSPTVFHGMNYSLVCPWNYSGMSLKLFLYS